MEDRKPRLTSKQIACIAVAFVTVCLCFVFAGNNNSAHQPEESFPVATDQVFTPSPSAESELVEETLSEEDHNLIIRSTIDQAVSDWESGIIDYEEASTILSEIQDICNPELADYAENHRKQIILSVIDATVLLLRINNELHQYPNHRLFYCIYKMRDPVRYA